MTQRVRVAVETTSRTIETTVVVSVLSTADAAIDKARQRVGVSPTVFTRGEVCGAAENGREPAVATATGTRAIADGGHPTRTVLVPTAAASGDCWHVPGGCGGHLVERVEATAAELVGERGLRPCQSEPCQANGIDEPVRCDGCGVSVFDPEAINAARYCPECATYLHKHPSQTDHELHALRAPSPGVAVTDGGYDEMPLPPLETDGGVSMQDDHGELKRRLAELVGADPSRYATETGVERHKKLTASEIGAVCEALGLGFVDGTAQTKRDTVMLKLGRDHRTGVTMWDASDLVAVIRRLEGETVATDGGQSEAEVEREEATECEGCDGVVRFDNSDPYYKTPDGRFWHPECVPEEVDDAE